MVHPVLAMAPESDWIRMWLDVYGSSFPIGSLEGRILACGASWSGWVGHPWGEKRLRFPREEGARGRNPLSSSSLRTLAFSSLSQPAPRWLRPPLGDAANQSFWSTLMTEHLQPTQLTHRGQMPDSSQAAGLGSATTAADATQR